MCIARRAGGNDEGTLEKRTGQRSPEKRQPAADWESDEEKLSKQIPDYQMAVRASIGQQNLMVFKSSILKFFEGDFEQIAPTFVQIIAEDLVG